MWALVGFCLAERLFYQIQIYAQVQWAKRLAEKISKEMMEEYKNSGGTSI
jgi:hypothetical protein